MPFGASVGPRRHDLILPRERTALVIVDLQERLAREVVRSDAVAGNAERLVEACVLLGVPVIVTEHNAEVFGPTVAAVRATLPSAAFFEKMIFSCFGVEAFREGVNALRKKHLIVAGLETHICVGQTVLDGIAHGYTMHVVRDACSARNESDHVAGLDKMAMAGAVPCTTEMAIFELLERAGTDEFRRLLPLIKKSK
jgi:nicotinamidase-related amidase